MKYELTERQRFYAELTVAVIIAVAFGVLYPVVLGWLVGD